MRTLLFVLLTKALQQQAKLTLAQVGGSHMKRVHAEHPITAVYAMAILSPGYEAHFKCPS